MSKIIENESEEQLLRRIARINNWLERWEEKLKKSGHKPSPVTPPYSVMLEKREERIDQLMQKEGTKAKKRREELKRYKGEK